MLVEKFLRIPSYQLARPSKLDELSLREFLVDQRARSLYLIVGANPQNSFVLS